MLKLLPAACQTGSQWSPAPTETLGAPIPEDTIVMELPPETLLNLTPCYSLRRLLVLAFFFLLRCCLTTNYKPALDQEASFHDARGPRVCGHLDCQF